MPFPMKKALMQVLTVLTVMTTLGATAAGDAKINKLSRKEKAAGWQLLFDGKDFNGWHNFKHEGVRPGWEVKDGALVCVDPHNAGDIVTSNQFGWFELQLDYNISEAGNSGIMFHVTDAGNAAWATGPNFNSRIMKRLRTKSAVAGFTPCINRRSILRPARPSMPPNRSANGTTSGSSSPLRNACTRSMA